MRHLDGDTCGLFSLVPLTASGTIQRLFDVVGRQHAEGHRDLRVAHHVADSIGDAVADVVEVRGATANHRAKHHDGIVAAALRQGASRKGNLEGTRNPGDVNVVGSFPTKGVLRCSSVQ